MAATRRTLKFESLDDVVRDAEHLLASGYDRAGYWDLGQAASHVAAWMSYGMDGFPKAPWAIRAILGVVRLAVGKKLLRKLFASGVMPTGGPTVPESVPDEGGDPAAAVATLRETVERAKAHAGPLHPSPLYGSLTKDEWVRLNLIHAAHHLSFLVPRQG